MTEDEILTFKEAMAFLKVSRSTIYRLMWSGQLQGFKVADGTNWRFYQRDLAQLIRAAEAGARVQGLHVTG